MGLTRSDGSPSSVRAPAASRWESSWPRAGYDFTIFDRADGFGGTWRHNTFPGAACDVPSHLYSYSFALNPRWSKTYANQPEILTYLEKVAADHGLGAHLISEHRGHHGAVVGRRATLDTVHRRRPRARLRCRGERGRDAGCALHSRYSGGAAVSGSPISFGALGSQQVDGGRAGGVHRHRRQRDPIRSRDRAKDRTAHGFSADADLDRTAV